MSMMQWTTNATTVFGFLNNIFLSDRDFIGLESEGEGDEKLIDWILCRDLISTTANLFSMHNDLEGRHNKILQLSE